MNMIIYSIKNEEKIAAKLHTLLDKYAVEVCHSIFYNVCMHNAKSDLRCFWER